MQILVNAFDWLEGSKQEFIDITLPLDGYPRLKSIFEVMMEPENSVKLSADLSVAEDWNWDLKIGDKHLQTLDPTYDYCVVDNNLIIYLHNIDYKTCVSLIKDLRAQNLELVSYK